MAEDGASTLPSFEKPVLVDVVASYFCARPRFAIYLRGLENEIARKNPADFGGLKSPTYLALNPQGKMPILILPDGRTIPESEVISAYILDKYPASGSGPSVTVSTVEGRLNENLIKRLLDTYVCTQIDGFYLKMEADERLAKLVNLRRQIMILDGYVKASPYAAGEEFSSADVAMFPAFVFVKKLSAFACGWEDVFRDCPNLKTWWDHVTKMPVAQKLQKEMEDALDSSLEGWLASSGVLEQLKSSDCQWKLC